MRNRLDSKKSMIAHTVYSPSSFIVRPPGTSFYLLGTGDAIRVDWKANPIAPEKEAMAETFIASASTYIMDIVDVLGTIYGFDYKKDLEEAVEAIKQFRKD